MENLEFQGKIELINKTANTEWHKWPSVNSLYCALNQEDSIDFSSKADTKNKKINSRTLLAPAHRMNSLCNLSPVTINPNRRLLKCYLLVRSGPFKFVMIKDHTASASTQKKKGKKRNNGEDILRYLQKYVFIEEQHKKIERKDTICWCRTIRVSLDSIPEKKIETFERSLTPVCV